jgi:chromate transporter
VGGIGCIGFGGPPAHIALLRQLCVDRRQWLDAQEFQDAIATCNLLAGGAAARDRAACRAGLGAAAALSRGVALRTVRY